MLEASTIYLLLAMFAFVLIAVLVLHQHNSNDAIRRKKNELESLKTHLDPRSDMYEEQITEIKIKIEELEEEIDILERRNQA